jgi:hypothetical protein
MDHDPFSCTQCDGRKEFVDGDEVTINYGLLRLRCRPCGYEMREVVRLTELRQAAGNRSRSKGNGPDPLNIELFRF